MIPHKLGPLLLFGLLSLFTLLPLAHADSYGYYAVGSFQFDSNSISGNSQGICSGNCAPWGALTILDVSFSSSVIGYQQSTSCSNDQCETELIGKLGTGTLSAEISVGTPPNVYYLQSASLQGSFDTHFCTGNCNTYRPETELSLDYSGQWSNDWYSTGTIQLECFQKSGCSDGSGAGNLNTFVPEPSNLALLAGGIASLGCAIRRKLL